MKKYIYNIQGNTERIFYVCVCKKKGISVATKKIHLEYTLSPFAYIFSFLAQGFVIQVPERHMLYFPYPLSGQTGTVTWLVMWTVKARKQEKGVGGGTDCGLKEVRLWKMWWENDRGNNRVDTFCVSTQCMQSAYLCFRKYLFPNLHFFYRICILHVS